MVTLTVGASAPWGYVRAVFARREGGFVVPVDLVRANLRAVCRVAVRRRLRADFAGYLVTDSDDEALRRLEIYGKKYAGKVAKFSDRREIYRPANDELSITGGARIEWLRYGDEAGGDIDAPGYMPGGACVSLWPVWFPGDTQPQKTVERGVWREPAFSKNRWLHDINTVCMTGVDMSRSCAWRNFVGEIDIQSIDAPGYIAAGSCVVLTELRNGRRLARSSNFSREVQQ